MFFYLLKNSTIIDLNLTEKERNTKVIIYGCICYIILHATLFIGGSEALLSSLKPYFWIFLMLDLTINYINNINDEYSENDNIKRSPLKQLNMVFDSFLKKKDIDGNKRFNVTTKSSLINKNNLINNSINNSMNNHKNNLKKDSRNIKKKVRFADYEESDYSSSDSDIGTDIDIESFKESLGYN